MIKTAIKFDSKIASIKRATGFDLQKIPSISPQTDGVLLDFDVLSDSTKRSKVHRVVASCRRAIKRYATHPSLIVPDSIHSCTPSPGRLATLLLGDTDCPTSPSSCLRVLSTNTETPIVTKTTMSADLLQAFQIIAKLRVDTVGKDLRVFAVDDIALTIEEPGWNLVLCWVLDDGNDSLELFRCEFTGTLLCQSVLLRTI